ncbi:hypothetical protein [Aeoliella sp. SH292]|uniref:hypothetical protein n=1 Tax=Aeoliella sp. SH292 TaxID=3454464 RepID=UPI003F9D7A0A
MPKVYDQHDLRFIYPDNWVVEEDEPGTADVAVTVASPQTGFWSVMLYRGEREMEPLTKAILDAIKSEYAQVEVDEIDDAQGVGYDVSFSYVDLLNTASIRAFYHAGNTYVVLCQAEDHELPMAEQVFAAMTMSLTRELPDLEGL